MAAGPMPPIQFSEIYSSGLAPVKKSTGKSIAKK
jgi:hypothetical protein